MDLEALLDLTILQLLLALLLALFRIVDQMLGFLRGTASMPVRPMRFASLEAPTDHSSELKDALEAGIEAFRSTGRVVSAEQANAAIAAVERVLQEAEGGRGRAAAVARPKTIRRSRFAKWTEEDFQALSEVNWGVLDPLWEKVEAGEVVADLELTQTQQTAIERGYKKVPPDARTERWPESQLVSKLRYMVKAFKHAESR